LRQFELLAAPGKYLDYNLYPAAEEDSIALDAGDGNVIYVALSGLRVRSLKGSQSETLQRLKRARGRAFVTQTRLGVFAQTRWRRALVGHIRYEWLVAVGFLEQRPLEQGGYLRLAFFDPLPGAQELLVADLGLTPAESSRELAREVARRAARHRISKEEAFLSHAEAKALHQLADPTTPEPEPDPVPYYFLRELEIAERRRLASL
jgi:hypothetical protein